MRIKLAKGEKVCYNAQSNEGRDPHAENWFSRRKA